MLTFTLPTVTHKHVEPELRCFQAAYAVPKGQHSAHPKVRQARQKRYAQEVDYGVHEIFMCQQQIKNHT